MSEEISREEIAALLARGSDEMTTDEYWHTIAESYREKPQEPCEDAISRQAAIDAAIEGADDWDGGYNPTREEYIKKAINTLPSVTPKQRTGHWITKDGKEQGYDICGVKTWYIQIMCSECGFIKTAIEGRTGQYHYCPSCGAKMESEEQA